MCRSETRTPKNCHFLHVNHMFVSTHSVCWGCPVSEGVCVCVCVCLWASGWFGCLAEHGSWSLWWGPPIIPLIWWKVQCCRNAFQHGERAARVPRLSDSPARLWLWPSAAAVVERAVKSIHQSFWSGQTRHKCGLSLKMNSSANDKMKAGDEREVQF